MRLVPEETYHPLGHDVSSQGPPVLDRPLWLSIRALLLDLRFTGPAIFSVTAVSARQLAFLYVLRYKQCADPGIEVMFTTA